MSQPLPPVYDPADAGDQLMHRIRNQLCETVLPGPEVQYRLAPTGRSEREHKARRRSHFRESSVMILICRDRIDGPSYVPLIRRADGPHVHAGQIALAGGKVELSDPSRWHAALRENEEELGLSTRLVTLLGRLSPVYIPVSRFAVYPYVGWYHGLPPAFYPAEEEVAEVLKLPLSELIHQEPSSRRVKIRGQNIEVPAFCLGEHVIWGATAMMLAEWKHICKHINLFPSG